MGIHLIEELDHAFSESTVASRLELEFVHVRVKAKVIHKERIVVSVISHCGSPFSLTKPSID